MFNATVYLTTITITRL